jgi:hypothetical protein
VSRRAWWFGLVCVLAVGGAFVAGAFDLGRTRAVVARSVQPEVAPAADADAAATGPRIVFRNTALGPDFGLVATVPLDDPGGPRTIRDLSCERIDMTRFGGSCLQAERGLVTQYSWLDLDPALSPVHEEPLAGLPSRTRMSPDGKLTASTVFVAGHSYLQTGFSTATVVRESGSGTSWGNLERFALSIDGESVKARDRNIWGVTFVDDTTFYATVATGGTTYLVEGDLSARTLVAVRSGAECPAVSPDGTRVAYKVDVAEGNDVRWVAAVLDLATGEERVLDRGGPSFDDQLEWLDDDTVLYGLPRADAPGVTDVWSLDVDAETDPRLLIEQAWSPAVVR